MTLTVGMVIETVGAQTNATKTQKKTLAPAILNLEDLFSKRELVFRELPNDVFPATLESPPTTEELRFARLRGIANRGGRIWDKSTAQVVYKHPYSMFATSKREEDQIFFVNHFRITDVKIEKAEKISFEKDITYRVAYRSTVRVAVSNLNLLQRPNVALGPNFPGENRDLFVLNLPFRAPIISKMEGYFRLSPAGWLEIDNPNRSTTSNVLEERAVSIGGVSLIGGKYIDPNTLSEATLIKQGAIEGPAKGASKKKVKKDEEKKSIALAKASVEKALGKFDKNNSGFLERSEANPFDKKWRLFDSNRDHRLSESELVNYYKSRLQQGQRRGRSPASPRRRSRGSR